MPEGFTYYDMARMLRAAIPAGLYRLEYNAIFSQDQDVQGRKGKAKALARRQNPEDFFPHLEKTFPNHEKLPADIWSGRTQFSFSSTSIESHGKSLGLKITSTHWLRVFGSLHGHILPMTRKDYDIYKARWVLDRFTPPYIPLAILGEEYCVAVVDREKLSTITTVTITPWITTWHKPGTGPCPITFPEDFKKNLLQGQKAARLKNSKKSIYVEMRDAEEIFNGIGTSHACEILHLAQLHPDHRASNIFNDFNLRLQLEKATSTFFAQATSQEYLQRVPTRKVTDSAFEFSRAVTRYINEQFTRVYRKRSVRVSLEHYQQLLDARVIAPVVGTGTQYKRLPVNCFRSQKSYFYTVLLKPTGEIPLTSTLVPREDWKGRALNASGNTAEIGIASFMDTVSHQKEKDSEVPKTSRKVSIRTGQKGRPLKRKWRNSDKHIIENREEQERKRREREEQDQGSEEEGEMGFGDILRDEERETSVMQGSDRDRIMSEDREEEIEEEDE